jgi:hypothetical protein
MFLGSCAGLATWSIYVYSFLRTFQSNADGNSVDLQVLLRVLLQELLVTRSRDSEAVDHVLNQLASLQFIKAPYQILKTIEFLFLSVAKLLVLDRMKDFSISKSKYSIFVPRVLVAIVVAACVTGVCASVVSAVRRTESVPLYRQSALVSLNAPTGAERRRNQEEKLNFFNRARERINEAERMDSVQKFSEMSVLLALSFCFLIAGILCSHRVIAFKRSLRLTNKDPSSSSPVLGVQRIHLQIVVTVAVVFLTFLPRAIHASLDAISSASGVQGDCLQSCSQTTSTICPIPPNEYYLMSTYLTYTPEFQLIVVLLSSPFALLVALWYEFCFCTVILFQLILHRRGMTSERMRHEMKSSSTRTDLPANRSIPR